MTAIFYIRDDSDLNWNRDLFVVAESYEESIALWRDNYEMAPDDEPVSVYQLPSVWNGMKAKVLGWNDVGGLPMVWKSKTVHPAI